MAKIPDSACALLLCDLEERGLLSAPLDKSHWNRFANTDGLKSEMWLYAYEASLKAWSGKPSNFVQTDTAFGLLFKRRVLFYDKQRNVMRLRKRIAKDLEAAKKSKFVNSFDFDEIDLDMIDIDYNDVYFDDDY